MATKTINRERQNEFVQQQLRNVNQVVKDLAQHGYTVLAVELDKHPPVIWIQYSKHCQQLGGACYRWHHTPRGMLFTYQIMVNGCKVVWQTDQPQVKKYEKCH